MVVSLWCSPVDLIADTLEAEGRERGRVVSPLKIVSFETRDSLTTPRAQKGYQDFHLTASRNF